jgi:predicted enzyme related to lactoylglutathione lyase
MSTPDNNFRLDYVEFAVSDIASVKNFYSRVFGWKFEDYGPEYTSFSDGRIAGGFFSSDQVKTGGPLVVIYASDLEGAQKRVASAGGQIVKDIFAFPGGRRFHFEDPTGHELAVWSNN